MMQSTYRGKVVGVSAAAGSFKDDDGNLIEFDSTKVYVELTLSGKQARGVATQVYKVGKSDVFKDLKLETCALPFWAEFDVRKVTNGREQKEEIVGFRMIETENRATPANQPAAAQKAA